jgi:anaerobic selenocysteine-containing dehydrogenase
LKEEKYTSEELKKQNTGRFTITRRNFLKASAALGAIAALGGSTTGTLGKTVEAAEITSTDEIKVIPTFCQMCGPHQIKCAVLCTVKNGKWVGVQGNPEAGNNYGRGSTSICAKGNAAPQTVYAPNRIKYPMKRVGAKGENKFERITWDEALDTIANKLKEAKEKYGPESYAILSPEYWPVNGSVARRFLNVYGSPNYLHSGICALQRMFSGKVSIGSASTTPGQMDKTKLLVVWGSNAENSAVNQGGPWSRVEAIAKGMKVIDIRPMLDPLGAKADIWIPIRPGTDCALALAILNVIIGEKLYDFDFVNEWCYGFEELAEYVKQYTPDWAAPITGISAEKITEIARMMGTIKPMGIATGNGIGDQQNDGNWETICINLIVAITGNLDVAGGGGAGLSTGPSLIKTNGIPTLTDRLSASEEDIAKGYYAGMSKLVAPESPRWFQKPATWESGPNSAYYKALMSILTEKPYPIRVLNGTRSTPLSATRQPKKVVEALKKLDFMFAMDIWWAPHLAYADIVLPACSGYEQSCQVGTKNMADGTWIGCTNVIVEPPGECKSDWQFYLDLAVKMGYGDDFWGGDMDACMAEQLQPSGISLDELRAAPRGIFVTRTDPVPETTYKKYATLFASLPHGKVQCYNEYIGGKPNTDETGILPYLPVYKGPPEGIAQTPELAKEYPLIISDVHADRRCEHSFHHNVPYLRELQPYPWVKINPATAKKYGIENGDWIKVESPYGWVKMTAEYFDGIAPDVLMSKRGWWQECEDLNLPGYDVFDGGSEVNVLYNSDETLFDEFHSGMAKQTLVKISKVEE